MSNSVCDEIIGYAFGLEGERCSAQFDNLDRMFISRSMNILEMREEDEQSNALLCDVWPN